MLLFVILLLTHAISDAQSAEKLQSLLRVDNDVSKERRIE